jgi:CHAT domain-containing protein/tetratricopeptide (TPR) repeat protein
MFLQNITCYQIKIIAKQNEHTYYFFAFKLSILHARDHRAHLYNTKFRETIFKMSRITFTQRFVTVLVTNLLFCLLICAPSFAQTSSADEASLRSLIQRYFVIYEKRDLNELLKLWSEKSPDLASNRKSLEDTFAKSSRIELKGLSLGKMTIHTDKAQMRLGVEITAIDAKSEKPMEGFGKMNRTLHLVKESGEWKIWQNLSSEEELGTALVQAKTEEERKQLLEVDKELVTVSLVQALLVQGRRLIMQSENSQALEIIGLTVELASQLGDRKSAVIALRGIGNIHTGQGNYTQALEAYHKSLKIAEEISDNIGISNVLNNIGSVHRYQGNHIQALEFHQRSLKIAEGTNNQLGIAYALGNMANIYQIQGNYTQALEFHQRSLKITEEIGDKRGIGIALNNIGVIYQLQGNYTQALEYQQKTLKITEEIGNKAVFGLAMNNLGFIHQLQGNYRQALEAYHKSLKIAEEIDNKAEVGLRLNNIGNIHHLQDNYPQSLESYYKSLKIAEEIGNKAGIGTVLNNIGLVYQSQGNYTQALEFHQRSLNLTEEIGDKASTGYTLYNIGLVHQSQGNYKQAVEFANRATDIAQQMGALDQLSDSRILAGQAYQTLNQHEQAKKAFTDAISAVEETRNQIAGNQQQQQQFFAGKLAPYYGMVSLLIGQNNPTDAFAFAERAKARALLDVLQTGKQNITRAMSLAEKQQERQLNSQLVFLNTQIYTERLQDQQDPARLNDLNARLQKARLEMEAFQTSLYAAHPELKVQRGQAQPITLAEAATLIPDSKTALLEFVVSEDQTYLFALSKSTSQSAPDLKVYKIDIKQKELAKLCSEFRQRLADRRISYQDIASKLYDLLLKPVRAQLTGKTSLIIIPDGVLWELPFQALQPTRNHFLIEDVAISYAPSLTVLQKMYQTRQKRSIAPANTLLAIGNPIIGAETSARLTAALMDDPLLPLPEAERQVKLLQKLYTPSRSKVYIGKEAGEAKVKAEAGNSRILHLATHGILNDASPMYSQIVLAHNQADTNEDGLLEAWEIMNLELNADLVVLSACETARGKLGAGEGMIGLSWALFVAGSPATVVSQWKVESASTTQLMVAFHRNLQTATGKQSLKMTKAEAMRRAALKLLKTPNYKHPFYWAAFVVIGDAS